MKRGNSKNNENFILGFEKWSEFSREVTKTETIEDIWTEQKKEKEVWDHCNFIK